jgi:hypothetical protein
MIVSFSGKPLNTFLPIISLPIFSETGEYPGLVCLEFFSFVLEFVNRSGLGIDLELSSNGILLIFLLRGRRNLEDYSVLISVYCSACFFF